MKSVSLWAAAGAACVSAGLAVAPVHAQETLHPVLVEAFANSDLAAREEDWRFTLRVTNDDGELVGRFDGSLADGERWQLVSPPEDELSDMQAGLWAGFAEDEDEDGDEDGDDEAGDDDTGNGLFFSLAEADIAPGSLSLAEETGSGWIFDFEPELGDEEMDVAGHLRGRLTIGGRPTEVQELRLWAPESFKPHFAVRLHAFEMVQAYERVDGVPAPVLTRLSQSISGSAAFQGFDQSFELAFSDIEFLGEAVSGR